MNTVLWVFIALAFGVILFTGLQDDLPEELSFLKNKSGVTTQGTVPLGTKVSSYQGWTIRQTSTAVELVKPLQAKIEVNGSAYVNPEFGYLCNAGKLDMRIDTHSSTTGTRMTPVSVAGVGRQEWDKSKSANIFPKDPHALLKVLTSTPSVEFTLSYAELGLQRVTLDTQGLDALIKDLPPSCH